MKRIIGAAAAAFALLWAGAASATSVITFDDGVAGQTEGAWTLVDDGAGGLAASTTAKHPKYGYIALRFFGIHTDSTFAPAFGFPLDSDYSDGFADEATFFDIIFPQGGCIKMWWANECFAAGERASTNVQGIYFIIADEVWIDNVQFEQMDIRGYVPEPATWAMMIIGFGLVGSAIRRHPLTVT